MSLRSRLLGRILSARRDEAVNVITAEAAPDARFRIIADRIDASVLGCEMRLVGEGLDLSLLVEGRRLYAVSFSADGAPPVGIDRMKDRANPDSQAVARSLALVLAEFCQIPVALAIRTGPTDRKFESSRGIGVDELRRAYAALNDPAPAPAPPEPAPDDAVLAETAPVVFERANAGPPGIGTDAGAKTPPESAGATGQNRPGAFGREAQSLLDGVGTYPAPRTSEDSDDIATDEEALLRAAQAQLSPHLGPDLLMVLLPAHGEETAILIALGDTSGLRARIRPATLGKCLMLWNRTGASTDSA